MREYLLCRGEEVAHVGPRRMGRNPARTAPQGLTSSAVDKV
jgi:hypothetical protein